MAAVKDEDELKRNRARSARKPRAARVRAHHSWCFTLHNPHIHIRTGLTKEPEDCILGKNYLYMVVGREIGGINNTFHYQGYVYFSSRKSWKDVSLMFPRYHVEVARKLAAPNVAYCKKESNWSDYGSYSDILCHQDILFRSKFPKWHADVVSHERFEHADKL